MESHITRSKVELLLIEVIVRDMSLSVYPHNFSLIVYHRYGVIKDINILLIKAYGDYDAQFLGNFTEVADSIIFLNAFLVLK